jgi:O-acetylhomoserine/O-acetylserine sulfhydrylase
MIVSSVKSDDIARSVSNVGHRNRPKFETLQVHAGQEPDPATNARSVPIYASAAYTFNNAKPGRVLFSFKATGNGYSR